MRRTTIDMFSPRCAAARAAVSHSGPYRMRRWGVGPPAYGRPPLLFGFSVMQSPYHKIFAAYLHTRQLVWYSIYEQGERPPETRKGWVPWPSW